MNLLARKKETVIILGLGSATKLVEHVAVFN